MTGEVNTKVKSCCGCTRTNFYSVPLYAMHWSRTCISPEVKTLHENDRLTAQRCCSSTTPHEGAHSTSHTFDLPPTQLNFYSAPSPFIVVLFASPCPPPFFPNNTDNSLSATGEKAIGAPVQYNTCSHNISPRTFHTVT